jgi:hypothetical protein
MKRNLCQAYLVIIGLGIYLDVSAALPGESIVKDAQTGNYNITYCGIGPVGAKSSCVLRQVVFVPATKISPQLMSSFKLDKQFSVQYRFTVANSSTSIQPLISFILDPASNIVSQIPLSKGWGVRTELQMQAEADAGRRALTTPISWEGDVLPSDKGGLRIVWDYKNSDDVKSGLQPGMSLSGFEFSSQDLPGIGVASFSGNSGLGLAFVDSGPTGDIEQQINQLHANDFVRRYTAIPAINVANPFNAAAVLRSIQQQVQTWVAMQLLDPALSSQIDRSFEAAIDAAGRGDWKKTNGSLREIRKLVRGIHQDVDSDLADDNVGRSSKEGKLIAKLPARVLNFNLKFVSKRMGESED